MDLNKMEEILKEHGNKLTNANIESYCEVFNKMKQDIINIDTSNYNHDALMYNSGLIDGISNCINLLNSIKNKG